MASVHHPSIHSWLSGPPRGEEGGDGKWNGDWSQRLCCRPLYGDPSAPEHLWSSCCIWQMDRADSAGEQQGEERWTLSVKVDVDHVIITSLVAAVDTHLDIKCSYAKWITWLSSLPGESGAVATINFVKTIPLSWCWSGHRLSRHISRALLLLGGPDRGGKMYVVE